MLTYAGLLLFALLDDNSNGVSNAARNALFAGFTVVWFIIVCALIILGIIIYWRIAQKAGYNGALSLLMFIPLVNLIILLIFAFGEWPIEAELKRLRGSAPIR